MCFVLMPFRPDLDEIYRKILKPTLEGDALGMRCVRADEIFTDKPIISDIWEHIQRAELIVAELTGRNPNVFYELGLSHAVRKRVVLITQTLDDVPFDLKHRRVIIYKHTLEGAEDLAADLTTAVQALRSTDDSEQPPAVFGLHSDATWELEDPYGLYTALEVIAQQESEAKADRTVATMLLRKLIRLGERGQVDSNLLFNSSTVAARLDFDLQAVKLAALCAHGDPKPSHFARLYRLEEVFGIRFTISSGSLQVEEAPANLIREDAWRRVLSLIADRPTLQCELVLAEAHNIAVRNRESGYLDQLIEAIEHYAKEDEPPPSYSLVILSGLYAMRGSTDWRLDYQRCVDRAIQLLLAESPMVTWYRHSVRELLSHATMLNELEKVAAALSGAGIQIPSSLSR